MLGAYNENPYMELYQVLKDKFVYNPNESVTNIDDDIAFKLILQNNGCSFSDKCLYTHKYLNYTSNYGICFIHGAMGNTVNEYFDYIEFYGMKYLIIFMDYFKEFGVKKPVTNDEVNDTLNELMGNSVYFDAIKKIVDVFIYTTVNPSLMNSFLSTTSAANNYRYMGIFIAAKIIDEKCGLTENDVSIMDYKELKNTIDNMSMNLLMIGIKQYDE